MLLLRAGTKQWWTFKGEICVFSSRLVSLDEQVFPKTSGILPCVSKRVLMEWLI